MFTFVSGLKMRKIDEKKKNIRCDYYMWYLKVISSISSFVHNKRDLEVAAYMSSFIGVLVA